MIGLPASLPTVAIWVIVPVLLGVLLVVYLTLKYTPKIVRIFEEQPVFNPLRVSPSAADETVEFRTEDGLVLAGSLFRRRGGERAGILVFCHEFLSDRFSFLHYLDHLRDLGYDIFAFDFRNHGTSQCERTYNPMQWTSDREVRDLAAALTYLRARPDHDPAGFGIFGVSRGGTTALVAAASERDVWGVITDGAFPTQGTIVAYSRRWAEIYVPHTTLLRLVPGWLYSLLARVSRRLSERHLNCRFPDVEAAVAKLAPRPLLMIHGQRDAYIPAEIVRGLFRLNLGPKDLWVVPEAKHNGCRECDPEAYAARLVEFLERYAPRRPRRPAAREAHSPKEAPAAGREVHHAERDDYGAEAVSPEIAPAGREVAELESLERARRVATPISG